MSDRPRDLPGVSDMIRFISAGPAPSSDNIEPSLVLSEDSTGLTSAPVPAFQYRSYQTFVNSQGAAVEFESIQVAFGGVQDGTALAPDPLPNTFLDPSTNVFSTIEFSVVNKDYVIILARVRGRDARYYPRPGEDPDAIQLRLRAEYDNGAAPFVSAPQNLGVSFTQTEEVQLTEGGFESNTSVPLAFLVPLRSIITFVTLESVSYGLSLSLRVRRSPGVIDEFGFLAINRTNNSFSMAESRVGRTFGLVLDNVGAWDVLISPEAICRSNVTSAAANFNYSTRAYGRTPLDVDENFVVGIGNPVLNSDNDITSFDLSGLPAQVAAGISISPVSGYPKVWALRLQPSVREYLASIRRAAPSSSLQGCYVDLPVFARGSRSLAEGTANIRIFADVNCVFDYTFCEFYWNLGVPLDGRPPSIIANQMELKFEELVDCLTDARLVDNEVVATSYFLITMNNIPSLDTGTSMLLFKTPSRPAYLHRVYKPSSSTVFGLKRLPTGASTPPWVFNCPSLTASEINTVNRVKLYVAGSFSNPITDPVAIASRSQSESSICVVQPRFNFPPADEIAPDNPNEMILASFGFTFKNWRTTNNALFSESILLAAEFRYPTTVSVDLRIPFQAKLYYNEDRRVL